jgi:hypothetical protein
MIASRKIYGLIAAALMVGALAGCGGGGNNPGPNPNQDNVQVNGGIPSSNGQAVNANGEPLTIPASPNEQQITVVINGQSQTAIVPPLTQPVPAGTQLAVFPANVPIIQNLVLNPGQGLTRDPGQVIINGQVIEGVTVDDQGRLSDPIALVPSSQVEGGRYVAEFDGPWAIIAGQRRLDVGIFVVDFQVDNNGISSFPQSLTGQLPINGGSTADGRSFVSFTVDEAWAGHKASLQIVKSNGDLQKTINVPGTSGTFNDIFAGVGGNPQIPAAGVDAVIFRYNPAP